MEYIEESLDLGCPDPQAIFIDDYTWTRLFVISHIFNTYIILRELSFHVNFNQMMLRMLIKRAFCEFKNIYLVKVDKSLFKWQRM